VLRCGDQACTNSRARLFSPFVTESLDSTTQKTQKLHVANPRLTAWRARSHEGIHSKTSFRETPYLSLHILEDGSGWYSRCLGLAAPNAEFYTRDAQAAGDTLGHELRVLTVQYGTRLAIVFAAMVQQRADVLLVGIHPFFRERPEQVIMLAAHHIIGRPSLLSAARAGSLDRRRPVGWDLGVSTTADCHRRPRRACAARAPIAVATPACRACGGAPARNVRRSHPC
jgi:hypothetical protein